MKQVKRKPLPAEQTKPKFKSQPKLSGNVVSFRARKKKQYKKEGKSAEWIKTWEAKYTSPGGIKQ